MLWLMDKRGRLAANAHRIKGKGKEEERGKEERRRERNTEYPSGSQMAEREARWSSGELDNPSA